MRTGAECRLDLHCCRVSNMRRMKGRAPGSTCAAKDSFPIREAVCRRVMTRWRRRERSRVVSSSTRSGVQDTVCATESNWTPRKDRRWAGPSVLSGFTTRPN